MDVARVDVDVNRRSNRNDINNRCEVHKKADFREDFRQLDVQFFTCPLSNAF
jgi:hypothetical protein